MNDQANLNVSVVPRIVLDTNVCLDLFVFKDPNCVHLMQALRSGSIQAVTREDCDQEWGSVLDYPQLSLDELKRADACAAYDEFVRSLPSSEAAVSEPSALPRCEDPDDQKFLQLALATGARWLLSKDKALLKLNHHRHILEHFAIMTPQAWSFVDHSA